MRIGALKHVVRHLPTMMICLDVPVPIVQLALELNYLELLHNKKPSAA
jgi:hypothetical protein